MDQLPNFMLDLSNPDWNGIGSMLMATGILIVISTIVLFIVAKGMRRSASIEECIKATLGTGILGFLLATLLFGVVQYHAELRFTNQDMALYLMSGALLFIGIVFIRQYIVGSLGRAIVIAVLTSAITYGIFIALLTFGSVSLT